VLAQEKTIFDLVAVSLSELDEVTLRRLRRTRGALKNAFNPLLRRWRVSVLAETRKNNIVRDFPGVNSEINTQRMECAEECALVSTEPSGRGDHCTGMVILGVRIDVSDDIPRIITPCENSLVTIAAYAERSGVGDNFWLILAPAEYERGDIKIIKTTLGEIRHIRFNVEGHDAREL